MRSTNPRTGEPVGDAIADTPCEDLEAVCEAAAAAAAPFAALPLPQRAALLRAVADALGEHENDVVALADAETALGTARLGGELVRTRVQLELFADALEEGSFLEAIIDRADPARALPRPDLRRMLVPLGPVAVFAASNFPLAFSVAGGDTASALAAGCPVVVKAHPDHAGTSRLVGGIVADALAKAGAPDGVFAVVYGVETGRELVLNPAITAVGFTGSTGGGRALFDLASGRPDPIPFYGELGSVNPAVVLPGALAARGEAIAAGYVGSFTLGVGQFCTKPGLLFLPAGHGLEPALTEAVSGLDEAAMLSARIRSSFQQGAAELAGAPGVRALVPPRAATGPGHAARPALLAVDAATFAGSPETYAEECFGPISLVVEYRDRDELIAALSVVPGSLTGTVHGEPGSDDELASALLGLFTSRAGRVIWNGWPTGVAVTSAQQHGGPWPATTSSLHTSVGVTAIRRFLRPVAYQDVPDALLPEALRDANPLGIPRRES